MALPGRVIGVSIVIVIVIVTGISYIQLLRPHHLVTDWMAAPPINERTQSSPSVPFTAEEIVYLKYGEGKSTVHPRDPRYLNLIRSQIARYAPEKPSVVTDTDQSVFPEIANRLKSRRNGFFVECGANNGEFQSNTLRLERHFNWTGLLVEANPALAKELLMRNRKAFVYSGCLSPGRRPATLRFKSAGCCGGLVDTMSASLEKLAGPSGAEVDRIQCYPLSDLLAAINVNHVDYMSLDVHGAETAIIESIDFQSLRIDLIEVYEPNKTLQQGMIERYMKLFAATGLYKPIDFIAAHDIVVERK